MTMKTSFRIGKIIGIPISINWSWFIILGLIIISLAKGFYPDTAKGLPEYAYWLMAAISAILLFASLLLHELSHSYVAQRHKIPIRDITLFIFGGVAHITSEPEDPLTEFQMAIAGPVCSILIAVSFWTLTNFLFQAGAPIYILAVTQYIYMLNTILVLFNIVPGFPLDGGRILRSGLWAVFKDLKLATKIASLFGKGFAVFLISVGLYYFYLRNYATAMWFIFIGLFMWEAAALSYQNVIMQKALGGVHVGDIMSKNVVKVGSDLPLIELVENYFFKYRYTSFPVEHDGKIIGLITLHDIKDIPKNTWQTKTVSETMTKLSDDLIISPNSSVIGALTQMAQNGMGRLIVMQKDELVGVVSQKDITRLFMLKNNGA